MYSPKESTCVMTLRIVRYGKSQSNQKLDLHSIHHLLFTKTGDDGTLLLLPLSRLGGVGIGNYCLPDQFLQRIMLGNGKQ
jgi:hypothetical protein